MSGFKKEKRQQLCEENLASLTKERGHEFLGWNTDFSTVDSLVNIYCKSHKLTFTPTYKNYTASKFGCPKCCFTTVKDREELLINIAKTSSLSFIGWEGGVFHKRNLYKANFKCSICNETTSITYGNIINRGLHCSRCSSRYGFKGTEPYTFYLQKLENKDRPPIVKFGITRKRPYTRLCQQSSTSKYVHTLIFTHDFSSGYEAKELENIIKASFVTGVTTKEFLPDGFTETIDYTSLNDILDLINRRLINNVCTTT